MTGYTNSLNFPTLNPFQVTRSGNTNDVLVTKLNSSGSALIYSTYLGGNGSDVGNGIALDSSGNVWIVGSTSSTNLSTVNPLQSTNGGLNAVLVAKLNSSGSALVHCTYFGGSGDDVAYGIALDSVSNIYVAGVTNSPNFPTQSPLQTAAGFDDVLILKIGETYKISGRVANGGGTGISGVSMSLSGAQTATVQTDTNGNYSFENLPSGDDYTVTPSSPLYHFGPSNQTFNNLIANQTANFTTINVYTVTGRITGGGGSGIASVTVSLTGAQTASTQTDAGGYYYFTELPEDGNYTITPSSQSYNFSPASQTLSNLSGNQTVNFTAVLTYIISGQVTDSNGIGVGTVTMNLSGSKTATTQTNGARPSR